MYDRGADGEDDRQQADSGNPYFFNLEPTIALTNPLKEEVKFLALCL
jgi:hypothetical protein